MQDGNAFFVHNPDGALSVLNRNSERIARSLLRGQRANPNQAEILSVEDSLQLASGSSKTRVKAPAVVCSPTPCLG